tara:strand:+ start:685 stop:879 length:195 start_codon:yes stop_codon:yes gene_type:complete
MSKIKGGQNVIIPIYSGYRRHRRNPEQILIREEKYKERENYENNEDESTATENRWIGILRNIGR